MVNGIALGYMDWMEDRIDPDDEEAQRALRFTIMRRAGRANEVAPLALYLSVESATRYITGQIFPVDGGLLQHL
jgi:NAD(P)-dependent dehydrogenase (short-subunit alcohol dehydrogenase family)